MTLSALKKATALTALVSALLLALAAQPALADVRAGLDVLAPYGFRASASGANDIRARTLGTAVDFGAEAGLPVGLFRYAFGLGFVYMQNGTSSVSSREGDVQNMAVSPRMLYAKLRADFRWAFVSIRYLTGGGIARVVQDSIGFNYTLSNGQGFGAAVGLTLPVGRGFSLRLPVSFDSVTFSKGVLKGVDVETPPHAAPWRWSGISAGAGLEWAW